MVDRPLIPAMRRLLVVASLLVLAVGIPLMLRPTETADYFSWTIQPPLTAAFLGSAYWASFLLEFEASRRLTWHYARIAVPAVFAFTVLTLIATLGNLEKFHFGDPGVIVTIVTWGWLLVYAIVPIIMAVVWLRQAREPAVDGPRIRPTPAWFRGASIVVGAALIVYGAVMFVRPSAVASSWPWHLTTLTAQAVAAWLVGMGIASGTRGVGGRLEAHRARDGSELRARCPRGLLAHPLPRRRRLEPSERLDLPRRGDRARPARRLRLVRGNETDQLGPAGWVGSAHSLRRHPQRLLGHLRRDRALAEVVDRQRHRLEERPTKADQVGGR